MVLEISFWLSGSFPISGSGRMVDLATEDLNRHADFLLAGGKDPLVEMRSLYDMKLTLLRPFALFECEGFVDEDECKVCPFHCPLFPDEEDYQSWSDGEVPVDTAKGSKKKEKKTKQRYSYKKECHIPLVGQSSRGGLRREKKDAKTKAKNSKREEMQGDQVQAVSSTYLVNLGPNFQGKRNSIPQCGNKEADRKQTGEQMKKKTSVRGKSEVKGEKEKNRADCSLTRQESLHLYLSDDSDAGEDMKSPAEDECVKVIKILPPTKRPKLE